MSLPDLLCLVEGSLRPLSIQGWSGHIHAVDVIVDGTRNHRTTGKPEQHLATIQVYQIGRSHRLFGGSELS